MKKINLCTWCINGIRSHGEKVYVGDEIDYDEYFETHGKEAVCEWCNEAEVEIHECIFV